MSAKDYGLSGRSLESLQAGWYRALYQGAVDDALYKEVTLAGREAAELRAEAKYYRTLYKVAMKITSSLDPVSVLGSVAEAAAEAMGAKGCALMLLSEDGKELIHSADYGLSHKYVGKGPVYVDKSISDTLDGKSVAIFNVETDPRVQYGAAAVEEGIASILSVPIMLRGDVIGVMRVYTAARMEFNAGQIEFAEALASLGGIAIDNARAHFSLAEAYETLRRQKIPWAESFTKPSWR